MVYNPTHHDAVPFQLPNPKYRDAVKKPKYESLFHFIGGFESYRYSLCLGKEFSQ